MAKPKKVVAYHANFEFDCRIGDYTFWELSTSTKGNVFEEFRPGSVGRGWFNSFCGK